MPPRVLVVGGNGFLGKYVVRDLTRNGYLVKVGVSQLSCSQISNEILISPFSLVQEAKGNFDCIVNASGFYSRESRDELKPNFISVNVGVTESLAITSSAFKIPLVSLGTYFEMAPMGSDTLELPYTQSKIAARQILEDYIHHSKVPFYYIYLYDTYGHDDKRNKILYNILKSDRRKFIQEIRNPEAVINWTHASDVARVIRKTVELTKRSREICLHSFQIRSADEYKIGEFAALLARSNFEDLENQLENIRVTSLWDCAPLHEQFECFETLFNFIKSAG
jgi:nucleoside-diphosphate-sugar epimerase